MNEGMQIRIRLDLPVEVAQWPDFELQIDSEFPNADACFRSAIPNLVFRAFMI